MCFFNTPSALSFSKGSLEVFWFIAFEVEPFEVRVRTDGHRLQRAHTPLGNLIQADLLSDGVGGSMRKMC